MSLTALVCPPLSLLTMQHVDSYSHSRTSRGHPPPISHRTSSSSRRPQSAPSHDHRRSATSSSRTHRTTGDEVYVGKYKLLKTIGKGNFAKVKLAKHMPTGQEVSCDGIYFYWTCLSWVWMWPVAFLCLCSFWVCGGEQEAILFPSFLYLGGHKDYWNNSA